MPPALLCLGHAAHDTIYHVDRIPTTPAKVLASGYAESGGGMAANASVAAARLGARVQLWSRVGADPLGDRIIAELAAQGVDIHHVRRVPGCRSTSSPILVDDRGERLISTYNDPRLDPDPSWLPLDEINALDAVLADVRWPAGAVRVLDYARQRGIPAVFDGDAGPADALLDLAARASHAMFSEVGLAIASGITDPGAGLARIAAHTTAVVGVTLGAEGCLWREGECERRAPAPRVQAVDTLAAGDVWHGGVRVGARREAHGCRRRSLRQRRRRAQMHPAGGPQRRADAC
jgi:sulfofructose kinase